MDKFKNYLKAHKKALITGAVILTVVSAGAVLYVKYAGSGPLELEIPDLPVEA